MKQRYFRNKCGCVSPSVLSCMASLNLLYVSFFSFLALCSYVLIGFSGLVVSLGFVQLSLLGSSCLPCRQGKKRPDDKGQLLFCNPHPHPHPPSLCVCLSLSLCVCFCLSVFSFALFCVALSCEFRLPSFVLCCVVLPCFVFLSFWFKQNFIHSS